VTVAAQLSRGRTWWRSGVAEEGEGEGVRRLGFARGVRGAALIPSARGDALSSGERGGLGVHARAGARCSTARQG
jgi:hypothetical protein